MRFKFWNFKENRIFDVKDLRLFNDNLDKRFTIDGFRAITLDEKYKEIRHYQFDGKLLFDSGLKDYKNNHFFDGDIFQFESGCDTFKQIIFGINNCCTIGLDTDGFPVYYNLYDGLKDLYNANIFDNELIRAESFWQSDYNNLEFWKKFKFYKGYFYLWYRENNQWFDKFLEFKKWKL